MIEWVTSHWSTVIGGIAGALAIFAAFVAVREQEASIQTQRKNALRAVSAELAVIKATLDFASFTEQEPGQLKKLDFYPRVQSLALASSITGGLFASKDDAQLLGRLYCLHDDLAKLNTAIDSIAFPIVSEPVLVKTRIAIQKIRAGILVQIQDMTSLLAKSQYSIDSTAHFFDTDNIRGAIQWRLNKNE